MKETLYRIGTATAAAGRLRMGPQSFLLAK
jgi:hypothetical protein